MCRRVTPTPIACKARRGTSDKNSDVKSKTLSLKQGWTSRGFKKDTSGHTFDADSSLPMLKSTRTRVSTLGGKERRETIRLSVPSRDRLPEESKLRPRSLRWHQQEYRSLKPSPAEGRKHTSRSGSRYKSFHKERIQGGNGSQTTCGLARILPPTLTSILHRS